MEQINYDVQSYNLLHRYVIEDNYGKIYDIISEDNKTIDSVTRKGYTPLQIACELGLYDIVKLLLSYGASVSKTVNSTGWNALFAAIYSNNESIVELILENGAYVNCQLNDNTSPLLFACADMWNPNIMNLLINNRAQIALCNKWGHHPLFIACANNCYKCAKVLINAAKRLNILNKIINLPVFLVKFTEARI